MYLSGFVALVQKCTEKKELVKTLPNQPGHAPRANADARKGDGILSCKVKVSFESRIKRRVQWCDEACRSAEDGCINNFINKDQECVLCSA